MSGQVLIHVLMGMSIPMLARAQTPSADDVFNRAAREFIQVDRATALRTLDEGLRTFPGDARLLELAEELLKEQEQEQQQQQQRKEEQQEQGQDQQEKKEQEEGGQQGEDQRREEQQQQGNEEQQGKGPPSPRPDRMSEADARRILDALDQQERTAQEKALQHLRPAVRTPIEKDW